MAARRRSDWFARATGGTSGGHPLDELFAHSDRVNHPEQDRAFDQRPYFDDDDGHQDQDDDGHQDDDEDQGDEDQDDDDRPARQPGPVQVAGAGIASDGAGILLALFAYPLLVNLLRGGPQQMRAWVAAKFINRASAVGAGAQPQPPPPPAQRTPAQIPPASTATPVRTAPTPTTTRKVK